MGATSFVNVGAAVAAAWALAITGHASTAPIANANNFAAITAPFFREKSTRYCALWDSLTSTARTYLFVAEC
jgi:hypothetical protein